jgi:hypothetical protein
MASLARAARIKRQPDVCASAQLSLQFAVLAVCLVNKPLDDEANDSPGDDQEDADEEACRSTYLESPGDDETDNQPQGYEC